MYCSYTIYLQKKWRDMFNGRNYSKNNNNSFFIFPHYVNPSDAVMGPEPEEAIVLLSIHDGLWEKPLVREIRLVVEGENWSNDVQLKEEQRASQDKKSKGEIQATWLDNG